MSIAGRQNHSESGMSLEEVVLEPEASNEAPKFDSEKYYPRWAAINLLNKWPSRTRLDGFLKYSANHLAFHPDLREEVDYESLWEKMHSGFYDRSGSGARERSTILAAHLIFIYPERAAEIRKEVDWDTEWDLLGKIRDGSQGVVTVGSGPPASTQHLISYESLAERFATFVLVDPDKKNDLNITTKEESEIMAKYHKYCFEEKWGEVANLAKSILILFPSRKKELSLDKHFGKMRDAAYESFSEAASSRDKTNFEKSMPFLIAKDVRVTSNGVELIPESTVGYGDEPAKRPVRVKKN